MIEVQYSINDMQAPSNVPRFKKLVTWLCNQLHEGKTVHVGCIGGHGRTGTLFSALIAEATGEKDAIQWVRKHYCKKAVESESQIQFLKKHYGVSDVQPTKSEVRMAKSDTWKATSGDGQGQGSFFLSKSKSAAFKPAVSKRVVVPKGSTKSFNPMASSARSLWKTKK